MRVFYCLQNNLCFRRFNGELFQFNVLAQGYRDSPRIFTKLVKAPLSYLRSLGNILAAYLDDLLLLGYNLQDCMNNIKQTVELFTALGFTVNTEKSIFIPTNIIEFLGFLIDSITMTVKPTVHKSDAIKKSILEFLKKETFTIRNLSEIIGKLIALRPGNKFTLLYVKNLEIYRNKQLKFHKGNYEKSITLNHASKQDLIWWTQNIDNHPKPISPPKFNVCLQTDASKLIGWGAHFLNNRTGGLWSKKEKEYHINILELLAVKLALKSLCKNVYNEYILIKTDNSTVVACINKMGSSKFQLNKLTREIWDFTISHHNFIAATFIPGKINLIPDKESRNKRYVETEWNLNSQTFDIINKAFGPFNVDLFASRLNYKVKHYVSWRQDPGAKFCNAFLIPNWNEFYAYCFPPFNLINRVIQKVLQDQCTICLILPRWTSQQYWPVIQKLLIRPILVLDWRKDLLTNPILKHQNHPLIIKKKLTLIACVISGKNI